MTTRAALWLIWLATLGLMFWYMLWWLVLLVSHATITPHFAKIGVVLWCAWFGVSFANALNWTFFTKDEQANE